MAEREKAVEAIFREAAERWRARGTRSASAWLQHAIRQLRVAGEEADARARLEATP
jgi:hypothetical protein